MYEDIISLIIYRTQQVLQSFIILMADDQIRMLSHGFIHFPKSRSEPDM